MGSIVSCTLHHRSEHTGLSTKERKINDQEKEKNRIEEHHPKKGLNSLPLSLHITLLYASLRKLLSEKFSLHSEGTCIAVDHWGGEGGGGGGRGGRGLYSVIAEQGSPENIAFGFCF